MPAQEDTLRESADRDLPSLEIANGATALAAWVIERSPFDAGKADREAGDFQHHALWFMAVIGLRSLRAAMQAYRSGYEDQAVGYLRLIDEAWNRAMKVRGDKSGTYAQRWVEGKPPGKGAKLTEQDIWEFYSRPQHADPRAILDWVAISQPDGTAKVLIGPERRSDLANGALALMAGQVRDLAVCLAKQVELELSGLDALDSTIHELHARYGIADEDTDVPSRP